MSKIGKKNILIPKESSVKIEGGNLIITGPKGSKTLSINDKIFSSKLNEKNEFQILPLNKKVDRKTTIMWGTYRSLINNAVVGSSTGYEKILEQPDHSFTAKIVTRDKRPLLRQAWHFHPEIAQFTLGRMGFAKL